ncbi:hypothetical protein UFOVP623_44 [uncultured Caudovirales phage]|uniref:Uncharacterized protein n=1 Tax=uncultured Caudovirales phage TaxID=2100421 RepID=A0A6J5N1F6_9CAUD|nr:hypothetical protein UFOVP623_44 [uncultured Caudovirales phage]
MTKLTKKSYYIVATKNGEHFYHEGQFTEAEINKQINDFDIDEFLADEATDEEFSGPEEGHYAIYRQSMMTHDEEVSLGLVTLIDNGNGDYTSIFNSHAWTPEQNAIYEKRKQELEQEVEAEFGVDNDPLVCLKPFSKVVA